MIRKRVQKLGCRHSSVCTCQLGFESQTHHLYLYHLQSNLCCICHVKRTKINKKWPSLTHFTKNLEVLLNKQQCFYSLLSFLIFPLTFDTHTHPKVNFKLKLGMYCIQHKVIFVSQFKNSTLHLLHEEKEVGNSIEIQILNT